MTAMTRSVFFVAFTLGVAACGAVGAPPMGRYSVDFLASWPVPPEQTVVRSTPDRISSRFDSHFGVPRGTHFTEARVSRVDQGTLCFTVLSQHVRPPHLPPLDLQSFDFSLRVDDAQAERGLVTGRQPTVTHVRGLTHSCTDPEMGSSRSLPICRAVPAEVAVYVASADVCFARPPANSRRLRLFGWGYGEILDYDQSVLWDLFDVTWEFYAASPGPDALPANGTPVVTTSGGVR